MTATVSESCCDDDDDDNNNNNNNNINSQRTIKNRLSPAQINTGKWVRLLNIIIQEQSVASLGGMQGLKLFLSTIVFSVWWLQRPLVFRASFDRSGPELAQTEPGRGADRLQDCAALRESRSVWTVCVELSLASWLEWRIVYVFIVTFIKFLVC